MNFSKSTEYILQIMSLMAQDKTRLYSTDQIYNELKIPYRYLRRLMTSLAKKDLITSIQGKYGGYRITKPLESISIKDILEASNDNFLSMNCFFGFEKCALTNKCIMHDKWGSIQENIKQVLESTSLAEIKKNGTIKIVPSK